MIDIKTVNEDDFESILSLNNKHIRPCELAWRVSHKDLKNLLNRSHSLIARDNDKLAGYFITFDHDAPTTIQKELLPNFYKSVSQNILNQIEICIGQVCVDDTYQGQGIGKSLYQQFFQLNEDYDLRIGELYTKYKPASNLYCRKMKTPLIGFVNEDIDRIIFANVLKINPAVEQEIERLSSNCQRIIDSQASRNHQK